MPDNENVDQPDIDQPAQPEPVKRTETVTRVVQETVTREPTESDDDEG